MLYMELVLHNRIGVPIYLEIPIPPECMQAIRMSKITRAEFLFHEKSKDGKLVTPANVGRTELNKFKVV